MPKTIHFRGKDYPSKIALCREYGIQYMLFIQRERQGWSIEDAVETGVGELRSGGNPVELNGIRYPTVKAVAKEYGLSYSRLAHYYYRNHDIEVSVQRCLESQGITVELWGRKYNGIAEVSLRFGLKYAALAQRIRDGMELPRAVKTMLGKEPILFQGKQYENFVDLCAEYQIQPGNVYDRLGLGLTLEDALTRPIRDMGRRNYVYYAGKEYMSLRDLCRAYGISEMCVREQTRRNPIQFLDAFELLVRLKEQARIPREEYLNYIPGCRVRGKSYKTVAVFAAEFGMATTTLYTYKSRHSCVTVFDAFRQMQGEVRRAYLVDGKPEFYSDMLKKYGQYQAMKLRQEKVTVPRYLRLQGFDFQTECYDTLAIYEGLLKEKVLQVTEEQSAMETREGQAMEMGGMQ